MKYLLGIIVIALIAGGVFAGFNLGKNDNGDKTNNTTKNGASSTSKTASNSKVMDLSNQGITKVTEDIYGKTDTTELILSSNSIQTLPTEMGRMTNLELFKIDHNKLDGSLIGEIRQMSRLTTLDVSYNNMTGMPAEIGQLNKLQTLDYSYNKISGLPNELENLKNNLKEFNLTGNPLSQNQITELKAKLPNTNVIF